MTQHVALRCKPGTARSCRHILDKSLLPQFGSRRLGEITPDEVAALHYRLHATPIMANQTVSLLSRLFQRAAAAGDAPAGGNPCRFIKKYPTRSRERFLSKPEYDRLGIVLHRLERAGRVSASAAAALRLLMLTGCRRSEILTLQVGGRRPRTRRAPVARREDRRARRPAVADGETGAHRHAPPAGQPLGHLRARARHAARQPERASWQLVRREAGLEDVRLHDLRHSFASRALALGQSLPMIAKLLGHTQLQTTARYAHLAPSSVMTVADRVADSLADDMDRELYGKLERLSNEKFLRSFRLRMLLHFTNLGDTAVRLPLE